MSVVLVPHSPHESLQKHWNSEEYQVREKVLQCLPTIHGLVRSKGIQTPSFVLIAAESPLHQSLLIWRVISCGLLLLSPTLLPKTLSVSTRTPCPACSFQLAKQKCCAAQDAPGSQKWASSKMVSKVGYLRLGLC